MPSDFPNSPYYHTVLQVLGFSEVAEHYGLDVDELLRASGLTREMTRQASVPFECVERMGQIIVARTGEPFLGLRSSNNVGPHEGGLVGQYVLTEARGEQLIRDGYNQLRLSSNLMEFDLIFDPPVGRLTLELNLPVARLAQFADSNFATFVNNIRRLLDPDFRPIEVRLTHGAPEDETEYRALFRCPILFGQPRYELLFDPSVGQLSPRSYDPKLREALAPFMELERAMNWALPKGPVHGAVRSKVKALLKGVAPSMETVAEALGLKPRTLQHQLAQENTTYREILEEVRRDFGIHAVRSGANLEWVTRHLGYAEVSAFYRAFRRWTGRTPKAFLASATSESQDDAD